MSRNATVRPSAPQGQPTVRAPKPRAPVAVSRPQSDGLDLAIEQARQRGAARAADILRRPEMLTARALAERMGASHETINKRRQRGELLALEGATRGFRYPSWQVGPDGLPVPGLVEVSSEITGGPWAVYRFLTETHGSLRGRTAIEALVAGDLDDVLDAARSIGRGAFT